VAESGWDVVDGGAQFLTGLAQGVSPRAVAVAPPGRDPAALIAQAGVACLASGRGVLVVAPDGRDADRFLEAFIAAGVPAEMVVHLAADVGPAERYRRFLRVLRGQARVVIGARAATFAPVHELGLAVLWDDGDDLHAEPRSPYPHAREVLALRTTVGSGCGLLVLGHVRTAEGERLVRSGWANALHATRAFVRDTAAEVRTAADDADSGRDLDARSARIPGIVLRTLREALTRGPVLVQVPRAGYVPLLRCQDCRSAARCQSCTGPLRLEGDRAAPVCTWCGTDHSDWHCSSCSGQRLRVSRSGVRRTAEELGRALPGAPVITSGRDGIVATVGSAPALVLATPGAEPVAAGGYAAVALLDGDRLLDRADLRASEEALRRWANAAALCRTREEAGQVVVVAEPSMPAVQALVRRDPEGFAQQEFDERAAAHMPPAARVITLTAPGADLAEYLAAVELPRGTEVLGPSPTSPARQGSDAPEPAGRQSPLKERVVLRVPLASGGALASAIRAVAAVRSAHKREHVMVQVDPLVLD
jgi:primosomal protein N' (replication factor Y)